nr:hypothetical protein [Mycoplasmopsis bovis]
MEIFVWKIRKILDLGNSLKNFFEWNAENKKLSEHISDDQWKRFSE